MKKLVILIILILVSAISFFVGLNFEKLKNNFLEIFNRSISCSTDVLVCPDGDVVGRIPPKCDFAPCPTILPTKTLKNDRMICGGLANIQCPKEYVCQMNKRFPDGTGVCVKKEMEIFKDFQCPEKNYIDCMPKIGIIKSECNPVYIEWVKKNCPNFKEVVY